MASIAAELFQVLTKHPYEPILRLIPQDAKCTKKELDAERVAEAERYMIDTTHCITKGGKLKANGLFDIFTRYSHKSPSETRSDMIDWANDTSKKLNKYAGFTLRQRGKSVANWLNDMRSENTPGNEIAIYCLSNMYLRHVFVKTGILFWTTVSHKWGDNESELRPKCELILMYLGHGRYSKYISVVTPEQDIVTLNDLTTNKPVSPKKYPRKKQDKHAKPTEETVPVQRSTRTKKCVNYADLNLGIDSNDDKSPPCKCRVRQQLYANPPKQW